MSVDMSTGKSVGVVVPVLNEEKVIAANLDQLLRDPAIAAVVVVDGGSTDATLMEVHKQRRKHPDRLLQIDSAPGRGRQMNAGAQHLQTDWLLFHHADSILPSNAGSMLAGLPEAIVWGGFRHRFNPSNWKLAVVSALHNFRCRTSGVVYGDQSMFVRRSFFFELGGFAQAGLEDLDFSDRALALKKSHLLPACVDTASRKFTQIGEFKALAQVISIILRYERQRKLGNDSFFKNYR
ncbi:MAG: glycosyltransferase family 2 protein [Pseudomonadota bacterium]